ncbi:MAG: TonB-dependent receptor [bacterium]
MAKQARMRRARWILRVAAWFQLFTGVGPQAAAQEEGYLLEPVVITATRTGVPLGELGVSATVITAEEIERRQSSDVLEVLRDAAGLNVVQQGSRGAQTELYPRGGESNYTMVLIDGVQVNEAGGAFDFANLTTLDIDRIEIIRGPQSALYGSDAIGGVIHVITKKGKGKPAATVSTAHGAHSENGNYMGEQKIRISGGSESIAASFGYARVDDGGILDLNNAFSSNTVSTRIDVRPGEKLGITFGGRLHDTRYEFPTEHGGDRPDEVFPGLDPDQFQENRDASVSGEVRVDWSPEWEHVFHMGAHFLDRDFVDPPNPAQSAFDAAPGSRTESFQTRATFDYHTNLRLGTNGKVPSTLTAGYEFEREDLDLDSLSTIVFGDPELGFFSTSDAEIEEDRHNHAFYLQAQSSLIERLHLVGGFRVEDNSEFGIDVNPRGSIAWNIKETDTRLRGAAGTGIKEPTFLENFGGFGTVGNPDLEPEESFSWEAGLDQLFWNGRIQLGATYFENQYDNLITFVFIPGTATSTFANIQEAESRGVEVTGQITVGWGVTLGGNYTYLETEVTDDGGTGNLFFAKGKPLLRRPRHSGSFFADWLWKGLSARLAGTYVGRRDDTSFRAELDPATGFYLFDTRRLVNDGYFVMDLAASYTLEELSRCPVKPLKFFLRGRNILDEEYEEALGFSSPRIRFMGGVELVF